MTVTIWHNPRCSKSRQTLALLEGQGIKPEVFLYLKTPLTVDKLRVLQSMLQIPVSDMMRRKEKAFRDLALSAEQTDESLLLAMCENPVLIERPVVISNGKARIGRPPERVLEIL